MADIFWPQPCDLGQAGMRKTFLLKELWRRLEGKTNACFFIMHDWDGVLCLQFLEEGAQTVHRYYKCFMDTLIDLVKLVMI